jgi:hypothetical protein
MQTFKICRKFEETFACFLIGGLGAACSPSLGQYFNYLPDATSAATASGSTASPVSSVSPVIPPPPEKTVCDPFGGEGESAGSEIGHGLVATLKYLTDDMPRYTSVNDYQKFGLPVDASFYFNHINTPTRAFTAGFLNQNGDALARPDGTLLFEYFSLHFQGQLQMPKGMATKRYQFAFLADDGAILNVDTGRGLEPLINGDGFHATQMFCASSPITLSSTQGIPIVLDYFQGPRYHISLVLMFREWTDQTSAGSAFDAHDPLCGAQGNDLFFDSSTVPSTPQTAYMDLLSRGWQVVPASYFYLPGNPPPPNPCL